MNPIRNVNTTVWAKKVIPVVHILHCTRGIIFLAHPVEIRTKKEI